MNVLQFPLIRITVFFIAGILFAQSAKPKADWVLISIFTTILLFFGSYFYPRKRPKQNLYFGISVFLLSFLAGTFALIYSDERRHPDHYLHLFSGKKDGKVQVEIIEKLKTTAYFDRYTGNILAFGNQECSGKVLLNIKKATTSNPIGTGTQLLVNGTLIKNSKPKNPDQFDYGKYLENQQVYAQLYTDYHRIRMGTVAKKSAFHYASKLRNKILRNFEKNGFGKTELAVVAALVLGQQQDISQEVIRDYQYAGAIHILSVSGLHVGLVLLFITFLLKPFPNTGNIRFIKLIVVLLSLWGFGILAGLAPSVIRSVTMFSFVAVAMFLRRSVNIYYTLFVSALLILLFRPSFLFDVGFQLSYIALFFIVWLQPLLASSWQPKNKIVLYFWEILTVSFAAQIGTFPLGIYYFHQFPGLFFATNLIVLPMLGIIMAIGVLAMLLAAFDWVWLPLLKLLEWSICFLNTIIGWVASFEDFVFRDIPLNGSMMLAAYLLIFSLAFWIIRPDYKKLITVMGAVALLQLLGFKTVYSNQKQNEFIIFSQKKNTLIAQRHGSKVIVCSNSKITGNPVLRSYLTANFCHLQKKVNLSKMYYFNHTKILLMDSSMAYKGIGKPDVLLLTGSPKVNLERVFLDWKPKQVVVDGSNFKSYAKRWKATCRKEKIPFHDVVEKGFYKL